jgi:uncharacterized protein
MGYIRNLSVIVAMVISLSMSQWGCKNSFLFYPYKQLVADPSSIGLEYEDINFKTEDGINLNGWWVPVKEAKGTVLFCHGNGGNISFLLDTIRIFHSLDLNVLVYDYRGYGKSGGSPTEEGTYLDAKAAWRYLSEAKRISPERIILAGRSLGGAIAAWLGQKYRPRMLILESTFTKAADVADFHYMIKPGCVVFGNTYNTEEYLAGVECPVLIVHSPDDEIIPHALGTRLFERARAPKEFLTIRGSHNSGFLESMAEYRAGLKRFISKYL